MLPNEAKWLGQQLANLSVEAVSPIINLGSSTRRFREYGQPFIHEHIIQPAEQRGIEFIHTDMEQGEGVDVSGDIFREDIFTTLKELSPKAIICANILEHVTSPSILANRCVELLPSGGYIFATVPNSFPYHPAPIDTLWRPDCHELASIFDQCVVLESCNVNCGTFYSQFMNQPIRLAKHLLQLALPIPNYRRFMSAWHRNFWIGKPYKTSCVLLKTKAPNQ